MALDPRHRLENSANDKSGAGLVGKHGPGNSNGEIYSKNKE